MKRLTDFEGREESAGPLFDFPELERAVRRAREVEATEPRIEVVSPSECASLRRDLGMSRAAHAAERASPGWEEQALADLRTFARTHARFAVEDFRAAFPPPEGVNPKALGSVVRRAARERIVIADGYVAVRCSNMSPRIAWKSLVYDGSPKP